MALTKMPDAKTRPTRVRPAVEKTWPRTMPRRPVTLAAALREPPSKRLFPDA